MQPRLRPPAPADAAPAGAICHAAFKAIAEHHDFPPDFPSVDVVAVFDHARSEGFARVLLVQAAYHGRSPSLYTRLGFRGLRNVEPVSLLTQGPYDGPRGAILPSIRY